MDRNFIRVDEWKPNLEDIIFKPNGKLVVIPFDEIFGRDDDTLNNFIVKKESYSKNLPAICKYNNYLLKFYDPDNEILLAYLKLKFHIDDKRRRLSLETFNNILYDILFTDSVVAKIEKMVEDNYYVDLSPKKDGKKYDESLEFTNEHGKILMQISVSIKLMIPVIMHYINAYNYLKNRNYLFILYRNLFDIFGGEINILNKLYISIASQSNQTFQKNKKVTTQREIFGVDHITKHDELLKDKIVSEAIFKYEFDKNIINFNSVILKSQLGFFLKEQYAHDRREISSKVLDPSGLSGIDKLEMNATKIDESLVILSDINIKNTIQRLEKETHVKITKDEIEYYRDSMHEISKFQSRLVIYFYAKYFGGFQDLNMVTRNQYFRLLVLLKKRLQYQGFVYLPQILTANIEGSINNRTIRNNKFFNMIESSSIYRNMMEGKFATLEEMDKDNIIMSILSKLINSKFSYVDYDNQHMYGELIEVDQEVLSDEFLNFLNQI